MTASAAPLSPYAFARHDFISFVRWIRPDLQIPPHWLYTAQVLEDLEAGREQYVIVEEPIRHGKTERYHRLFPAWYFGRNPTRQVMSATHKDALALDCGRDIRNYVEMPEYTQVFPGVSLAADSKAKGKFHVVKQGERRQGVLTTVGRRGDASGRGANLLIVDDLLGETEAYSDAAKEEARVMLRALIRRLEPHAAVLIIQSRVAEDDPAGYAEQAFPLLPWRRLRFPALAEKDEDFEMPDQTIWSRRMGEALWEKRWSRAYLEQQRAQLPAHEWSSSYQQRPIPLGSRLVEEKWFEERRYSEDPETLLGAALRIVVSADTSKGTATGARTAIGVWAELERGAYLVEVAAERWQVPQILARIRAICAANKPHVLLVEDKSTGEGIIQLLRDDVAFVTPIEGILPPPGMDKVVRFAVSTPAMREGQVWLPRKAHPRCAHWQARYEDELFRYPNCGEKDQCDMTSQYLNWRREHPLSLQAADHGLSRMADMFSRALTYSEVIP